MSKVNWLRNLESLLMRKTQILSIGLLLLLVLPRNLEAQIIITPQPYINSAGTAIGPVTIGSLNDAQEAELIIINKYLGTTVTCPASNVAQVVEICTGDWGGLYIYASDPGTNEDTTFQMGNGFGSVFQIFTAGASAAATLTSFWAGNHQLMQFRGTTLGNPPGVTILSPLLVSSPNITGSATQNSFLLTQTLNTSGASFDVFKIAVTDTAHGASTNLFALYGGASGTTTEFAVDLTGQASATNFVASTSGNGFTNAAGAKYTWSGRNSFGTTADKLYQLNDTGNTTGLELNVGTPTLGTCTGGSLVSGSHNFGGQYTGNTSSSCIINFGTPNFTNTPYCFAMSTASTTHPRISASSNSSITITGGVSGETITYHCDGRIGT